jgi:uncharacterized membrane protein YcaP (DUF421 family)
MPWLIGNSSTLGETAAKAALMYITALAALRLGERRTLAQWTIIDFATAVAMGAIIGRTAIAGTQSYLTGAVALYTLVAVHRLASLLRFRPVLGKLVDHRVRVLVDHGRVRRDQLRRCALTDNDLYTQLRQRGVFSLAEVRYVLYETKGSITIVSDDAPSNPEPELVQAGLEDAAGYS